MYRGSSKEMYYLFSCSISYRWFETASPSTEETVWMINLKRTSGVRQLVILCNDLKILDFTISNSTCGYNSTPWSRDVGKISFSPSDTASDYYKFSGFNTGNSMFKFYAA